MTSESTAYYSLEQADKIGEVFKSQNSMTIKSSKSNIKISNNSRILWLSYICRFGY